MTNREILSDLGYEDSIIFKNPDYDDAIIGVTYGGKVVYDFDLMVEHLITQYGMTEMDAVDFIYYNLSYASDSDPIVMYTIQN